MGADRRPALLGALLSSQLPMGSNRRADTALSSFLAFVPLAGGGAASVLGAVPADADDVLRGFGWSPERRVVAGARLVVVGPGAGTEDVDENAVQLWLGRGAVERGAALAAGGAAAPVQPSEGPRALVLPFAPRAAARTDAVARARRVAARLRRRLASGGVAADPGERGRGWYGLAGSDDAAPAAATVVLPHGEDATALPAHARHVLAEAGVELTGRTWRVLAEADYASQKLAFFVSEGPQSAPDVVVKLARDPRFSPRLRNEHEALVRLAALGPVGGARVPAPMHVASHGPLAVVVESAIAGVPFSELGRYEPGDPVLEAATDAVLAVTTAAFMRDEAGREEVATALAAVVERFTAAYGQEAAGACGVARHAGLLADAAPLATVLQHGDPGTWNLLVDGDGGIAILDWENAEARGLPIADALFLAVGVVRRSLEGAGRRPTPEAVSAELVGATRWRSWTAALVTRAAAASGVDRSLLPSLLVLGAVYQAVKEIPRLDPAAPGRGEWVRLLRAAAGGLERLVG